MAESKTKPVDELRIGSVKAAVWRNETKNGAVFNVTFSRLYHDGSDWRTSSSFGRDDLLVLAKVADQAHSRVLELGQEASGGE